MLLEAVSDIREPGLPDLRCTLLGMRADLLELRGLRQQRRQRLEQLIDAAEQAEERVRAKSLPLQNREQASVAICGVSAGAHLEQPYSGKHPRYQQQGRSCGHQRTDGLSQGSLASRDSPADRQDGLMASRAGTAFAETLLPQVVEDDFRAPAVASNSDDHFPTPATVSHRDDDSPVTYTTSEEHTPREPPAAQPATCSALGCMTSPHRGNSEREGDSGSDTDPDMPELIPYVYVREATQSWHGEGCTYPGVLLGLPGSEWDFDEDDSADEALSSSMSQGANRLDSCWGSCALR
eukprot:CAMPEP_0194488438 /NCGR_PEP_ID=MMETSP0253-20130528/8363_1 /TAXON_ID=2966 /ORGANISM="Noctiluca scintillans" /LENGTH=293 /DNA_ID=CAMNT_0039328803 /DNA_START=20 /DNA_END=898 /DNA_ORIENTATION=+